MISINLTRAFLVAFSQDSIAGLFEPGPVVDGRRGIAAPDRGQNFWPNLKPTVMGVIVTI